MRYKCGTITPQQQAGYVDMRPSSLAGIGNEAPPKWSDTCYKITREGALLLVLSEVMLAEVGCSDTVRYN